MSSDSRRQNSKATEDDSKGMRPDHSKFAIVSDYLKRTLSDRPYGFILASLSERLELHKIDQHLRSVGIVPAPPDFEMTKLLDERTLAFAPYCCKPFDCPQNEFTRRKSDTCKAIDGECDHATCTILHLIRIAKKLGIAEFHIVDTDAGLFEWLASKREEGYQHVISAACEFAVSYAFEVIHNQLGFDGLILLINGDKCRTKEEYAESDESDRGRITFVDDWTLAALETLVDHLQEGQGSSRESARSAASDNHR